MYEALYRKYRPQTFDDVVGQAHITDTLKQQVITSRLSHAYLFVGTRGTGKTTCARILAKAVNCQHPVDGNPCLMCDNCKAMEAGDLMDVTELDAASNNGVDDVRMLRDEAVFSPVRAKKRVYIIDEVHMLSKPAFNALLKILEEPPEHLLFILATTELNKVLPTILSRCQRHSFRRLDTTTIASRLDFIATQEGLQLSEEAVQLLGRLADGGMRDGISLLDQCASSQVISRDTVLSAMGLMGASFTAQLSRFMENKETQSALLFFRKMWQEGKDPASLLGELASYYRDALMLRLAPSAGEELLSGLYDVSTLTLVSGSESELLCTLNIIEKYLSGMRDTNNPRLQTELCIIELCGLKPSKSVYIPVYAPADVVVQATTNPVIGEEEKPAPTPVVEKKEKAPQPSPHVQEDDLPPWEENISAPVDELEEPPFVYEDEAPYVFRDEPPVDDYIPPWEEEAPSQPPTEETAQAPILYPQDSPLQGMSWKEIVDKLKDKLDMGTHMLFTDDFAVSGFWENGVLIIETMPGFYMNMLNKPAVLDAVKEVCGASVQCRELRSPAEIREDKLNALGNFGIVTYE